MEKKNRKKKWAEKFSSCLMCGTTEYRCYDKGMCRDCYMKFYNVYVLPEKGDKGYGDGE